MKTAILFAAVLTALAGAPQPVQAAVLVTGRVVAVEDGAHLVVVQNGVRHRVHLIGVAPVGGAARAYMVGQLLNRDVRLELDSWTPDADGAWLAYVTPVAQPGLVINIEVVERGYARVWDRGPRWHRRPAFFAAQERARARHAEIWREEEREARHGGGGGGHGHGHHHR